MIVPAFIRHHFRLRSLMRFYQPFVKSGDLCFDIGANVGERTEALLKLGARVVAVEPQRACVEQLNKKFSKHPLLTVVHGAVGDYKGTVQLNLCDETTECATFSEDFMKAYGTISNLHWRRKEAVQMTTLDALIESYGLPAFIKMDVEGYESKVLDGLHHTVPCISFEFNQQLLADTYKALQALDEIGRYECNLIEFERFRWLSGDWLPVQYLAQNFEFYLPTERVTGEIFARSFDLTAE